MNQMSNFSFLQAEWPALHDAATKAESLAYPDSRTACFYARRGLEVVVHWLYKHDASLQLPYQDNLSALIHEPTFRTAIDPAAACLLPKLADRPEVLLSGSARAVPSPHQTLCLPTPHRFGRATPPLHPAPVLESTLVMPAKP